jgi:hypothetical protein
MFLVGLGGRASVADNLSLFRAEKYSTSLTRSAAQYLIKTWLRIGLSSKECRKEERSLPSTGVWTLVGSLCMPEYSLIIGIINSHILFPTKQDHDPGLPFSFADPGPPLTGSLLLSIYPPGLFAPLSLRLFSTSLSTNIIFEHIL